MRRCVAWQSFNIVKDYLGSNLRGYTVTEKDVTLKKAVVFLEEFNQPQSFAETRQMLRGVRECATRRNSSLVGPDALRWRVQYHSIF